MTMKIGLNTDSLGALTRDQTLDLAAELGLDFVEFATGNWSGAPHLRLDELHTDPVARRRLRADLDARNLRISALTCSGNPLDPGPNGARHDAVTRRTIELAAMLDVDRVVLMSGLPAGRGDTTPNWIVVSWPPEAAETLEWQWTDVVLPYWEQLVTFTQQQGDIKLCLELHPQQIVYNVPTLQRLRACVGDTVGANLDPSHLMWLGADPIACVEALGEAIYHVHAKDTRIEPPAATRTVLETMSLFTPERDQRAWNYVTLGEGRPAAFWRDFCAALSDVGYDNGLSIEHEDPTGTPEEGVRRSVELLRQATQGLPAEAPVRGD